MKLPRLLLVGVLAVGVAGCGQQSLNSMLSDASVSTAARANALVSNQKSIANSAALGLSGATTDFNGDGKSDILWRDSATGEVIIWLMDGTTIASSGSPGAPGSDWSIQGIGDFDGDGKSDILWRDTATGETAIWLMNGTTIASSGSPGTPGPDWSIQGVGDFNGDGKADILWRNTATGEIAIWLMNGTTIASSGGAGAPGLDWSVQGVGDFNGDGKADILWRDTTTGEIAVWLMNGTTIASSGGAGAPGLDWSIQGVGDFNGDGKADILWRDATTGEIAIWFMNGTTIASSGGAEAPTLDWSIKGVGDYNGDGKADILWLDNNGEIAIWLMNAASIAASGSPGSATSGWQIADPSSPSGGSSSSSSSSGGASSSSSSSSGGSAPPTALSYGTLSPLFVGETVSLTPTVNGTVTRYTVTPALPSGLSLATTGVISGLPATVTPKQSYTVTASNSAGSTTTVLSLLVNSGPTLKVSVGTSVSISANGLSFYWKATDGQFVDSNGAPTAPPTTSTQVNWMLPQGQGIHFAYVLVADLSGNCYESRIAVNSDSFGASATPTSVVATNQPPYSGISCNLLTDPFFNVTASAGNVPAGSTPTGTIISSITAKLNGTSVGQLQPVFPAVIGSYTSEISNAFLPANYFLTAYGEDTAQSACQYYAAIGAATSTGSASGQCDQTGNILPSFTFTQWESLSGVNTASAVPSTYFINAVDLNLTREHRSIVPTSGSTLYAAYVCNHLPATDASGNPVTVSLPVPTSTEQAFIDTAISNAAAGKNLVACVAMDYITNGNGVQFTRFFVFGPSGQLLPSANLDQRGEKYVPGACISCHGGSTYLIAQQPTIGANFLPYDIDNFAFSDKPNFTEAAQDTQIHNLNANVARGPISTSANPSGVTTATIDLINGWFGPKGFDFVPSAWPDTAAGTSGFTYKQIYTNVVARSCRTCHAAQPSAYDWDSQGPTALGNDLSTVCMPPSTALPTDNIPMPDAVAEFNRFWDSHVNQATLPAGTPDQVVQLNALNPSVNCTPPAL
jgi:hypothetical protein